MIVPSDERLLLAPSRLITIKSSFYKADMCTHPMAFLISSAEVILQYPDALRPRDRLAVVIPSKCIASSNCCSLREVALCSNSASSVRLPCTKFGWSLPLTMFFLAP